MTSENDIVLIYFEDTPMAFARVEAITPDWKKHWYHIKLLMLQVPLQVVNWILKDVYIDGEEFTMNGKRMRIEKVICPEDDPLPDEDESHETQEKTESEEPSGQGKVITFKKKQDT